MKCQDCGQPATHEFLDAYGPGEHMPVCGPDGLYYVLQGYPVRPLPLTPVQALQAHNARRASAFHYVRITHARAVQGLPPFPETPPF